MLWKNLLDKAAGSRVTTGSASTTVTQDEEKDDPKCRRRDERYHFHVTFRSSSKEILTGFGRLGKSTLECIGKSSEHDNHVRQYQRTTGDDGSGNDKDPCLELCKGTVGSSEFSLYTTVYWKGAATMTMMLDRSSGTPGDGGSGDKDPCLALCKWTVGSSEFSLERSSDHDDDVG
jgi:hypothetical protein